MCTHCDTLAIKRGTRWGQESMTVRFTITIPDGMHSRCAEIQAQRGDSSLSETLRYLINVGMDSLESGDGARSVEAVIDARLSEFERSIREDFLQQDAFNPDDAYCSLQKQFDMVSLIFYFRAQALEALKKGADIEKIATLESREQIGRAKNVPEAEYRATFAEIRNQIDRELAALV